MPNLINCFSALLCKIGALRSFSLEGLQYWRERESGMSSLAYFLSKDTIDHFNTLVKPVVYLSMFYFFNNPRSSFVSNYAVLVALVYCVTGIGYTFAICFQQASAQLVRIEILSISFVCFSHHFRYCRMIDSSWAFPILPFGPRTFHLSTLSLNYPVSLQFLTVK